MPSIRYLLPLLLVGLLAAPAFAKEPPVRLKEMFREFLHGEEFLDAGEWSELKPWLESLDRLYRGVRPLLGDDVNPGLLKDFEQAFAGLHEATASHDRRHSRIHFLTLHKDFLEILDSYDNLQPPMLLMVENDLGEAATALQRGDRGELADELQEVELFFGRVRPQLQRRGMPTELLDGFRAALERGHRVLPAGERGELETVLTELQRLLAAQNRWLLTH